jgi:hypothetical protein
MRLLRLTTRKPTATFEATYNADIVLKPNSRIALQSVSINSRDLVVNINTDNNEVQYGIDSNYSRTIQLTPRNYESGDIDQLTTDFTDKLNNSCTFATPATEKKILGVEWLVDTDALNLINIQYKREPALVYKDSWTLTGTSFTQHNNSQYFLAPVNNVSVSDFSVNGLFNFYQARGNSYFRTRTRRMASGNTKDGYIMGVYKDGDITGTTLGLTDIVFGIRVRFDVATGTNPVYQYILNGVEDPTETPFGSPIVSDGASNDTQEIAIDGDKIKINFYAGGSDTPTTLFTQNYNQEKLRPVVAFFGSRSTTQVEMVRVLPSPYNEIMPTLDLSEGRDRDTNVAIPPKPKRVNDNDENFLFFQSPVLADFLGFDNQRTPITGSFLSGDVVYTSDREFDIPEVADAMLVQLLNLQVESYDSYSDLLTTRNGERSNILSVIPSKSSAGKIVYEPAYLTFIDLNNAEPIYLRNLNMRVVREDYSTINIDGLGTIVVIIE